MARFFIGYGVRLLIETSDPRRFY